MSSALPTPPPAQSKPWAPSIHATLFSVAVSAFMVSQNKFHPDVVMIAWIAAWVLFAAFTEKATT